MQILFLYNRKQENTSTILWGSDTNEFITITNEQKSYNLSN